MAATVYDGSLQFTSNIDDSELTSDAARMEKTLTQIVEVAEKGNKAMTDSNQKQVETAKQATASAQALHEALMSVVDANATAFNVQGLTKYAEQIETAGKAVMDMVEATGQNFGTEKLQVLDEQLKRATTDAEQLQVIFNFLKDNVADLKLSPADTDTFLAKLQQLIPVVQSLKEESQQLSAIEAKTWEDNTNFLNDHINDVKALEEELDRLINIEGILQRALGRTTNPELLDEYRSGLGRVGTQITAIAERLDELNASKFADSVETASESGANLLTQLREMRYAIADAMEQFGSGSPEVTKLIQQAAELEQRLRNADRQVALFGSNTAGLDALKEGFNGLFGGATALISAVSLLSGDNNALQETMVKLFAVMQVVNGAEQLFAVLNKNSATSAYLKGLAMKLSTKATADNTAATTANTAVKTENTVANDANAASLAADAGAMEAATGATGGLTAATSALASSLGIVALVLAEVIGLYEIYKQKQKDAALADELNNMRLENRLKVSQGAINDIKNQGDIAVAQLRATGAAQASIRDAQLRQLDEISRAADKNSFAAYDNLLSLQKRLADKYGAQIVNGSLVGGKKLSKEDLANYQKANDLYLQAQQAAAAASTQLRVKQLEDEQQLTQEGLLDYSASLATRIAKLKEEGDQEKALELQKQKNLSDAKAQAWGKDAAVRTKLFAEAAQKNADIDTQLKQLQISNAEAVAQKELTLSKEGSLAQYTAKAKLIELNAQKEIVAAKGNAAKIAEAKAQAEKAANDLTNQFNAAEVEREKGAAVAGINARLEAVQKGSNEELNLRLQLIAEKEKFDTANAQFTIKNEQERQTTITNIQTQALKDRRAAEKQYYDNLYDLQVQSVRRQASTNSLPFQATQNNPLAPDYEKDQAAINETLIRQKALQQELQIRVTEYTSAVSRGATNLADYKKKIDDVNAALAVLNVMLGNQRKQYQLDKTTEVSQNIQAIAQGFSTLASNIQSANPGLSEMAGLFSNLAGEANNLYLVFSKTASSGELAQIAIGGTVQLISMVINASAQRHQSEAQFNADLLAQQDEYNKALNESILLNYKLKDNIFVTDYQEQITDGVKALGDASDKYQEALKKLTDAQVIAGKRDAINWKAIVGGAATGAAVGATLGTVVPGIGNAIGAAAGWIVGAAGGVIGAVAGLFSKKSKDILKPILQEYPELLDKSKQGVDQFNDALAQSLIDSKLVKGQSEEVLKSLVEWKKAVEAANQQIEDAVSTLAGQLGDNLRDSLVQAFEDGTDAGKAFAQSVGDSLENVLKQLLFNSIFGDALKNLQDKLTATLENGGNVTDVYSQFFQTYSGLSKEFTDNLKALQQQAAANGLDIFQNSSQSSTPSTLAGAIKGISEDTATLLAGQFNAIRLEEITQTNLQKTMSGNMVKQINIMMQHLNYAIKIEANTGKTAQNTAALSNISKSLKSIDSKMSDFEAVKKANGVH